MRRFGSSPRRSGLSLLGPIGVPQLEHWTITNVARAEGCDREEYFAFLTTLSGHYLSCVWARQFSLPNPNNRNGPA